MASDNDSGDGKPKRKDVGYGRPPVDGRFKKGQRSANPMGRPRKSSSLSGIVRDELSESVTIRNEHGRRTRMSALRVLLKGMVQQALKGDKAARAELMKLMRALGESVTGEFLTPAEALKRAQEEEKKKKSAEALANFHIRFLDFISAAGKLGLIAVDSTGAPMISPLMAMVGTYVTRWGLDDQVSIRRERLVEFLEKLDDMRAEYQASRVYKPAD